MRSERELAAFPLIDDTFYSWTIASQIASGHGTTFDGVISTNGFQPLHVLALVPAYWLAGGNRSGAIPLLMALALVFSLAAAYCVWRLCRAVASQEASLVAVALWMLSPMVTCQMLNGLETAPSTALLAVSTLVYLRAASDPVPMLGRARALGLLLGLTILVRVDGALLAVAIGVAYLCAHRSRLTAAARTLAASASLTLLVCGGWFLSGWFHFGSILPNSGEAVRFLSFYLGRQALHLPMALPDPKIPLAYYVFNVKLTLGTLASFLPFFSASDPISAWNLVTGGVLTVGLIGAALVALRRRPSPPCALVLPMLVLHGIALGTAYCGYIFGQWYYSRYYAPLSVLLAVAAAGGFDAIGGARERKTGGLRWEPLGIAAVSILSSAWLFSTVVEGAFARAGTSPRYDAAMWLNQATPSDATIGAFQAGTLGYFTRRRVINLDGVVNPEALQAIRCGRFEEYLARNGVRLIVDDRWQLRNAFCDAGYPLVELSHLSPVPAPSLAAVAIRTDAEGLVEERPKTSEWLCGNPRSP